MEKLTPLYQLEIEHSFGQALFGAISPYDSLFTEAGISKNSRSKRRVGFSPRVAMIKANATLAQCRVCS